MNKWTAENTNIAVGTIVVILCLGGLIYYGMNLYKDSEGTELQQSQFLISGSGVDSSFAFDNDPNTAWMGAESRSYSSYNYMVVDFQKKVEISKITMLLGGSGAPIDYLVTIQSSNNGNIWNDVIGSIETGYFSDKTSFEFPMLTQNTRYLRIGIKPYGTSFQKFKVYEIMFN